MEDFRQKIRNGDVEGIQKLVKKNPTIINKPIDGFGITPLMLASQVGADRRILDILIKAGAKLGAKDIWGNTALHWAVNWRRLQAVELLLSRGSNVNEKTNRGYTPLHLAASSSPEWTDGVKAIMKEEAVEVNPRNEYGQTPLHRACWWGHLHIVEILLGHNGIDANVVDKYGDTPLHEAVRGQRYDTVLKMLNKDSVKFDMEGNHKMTPFLQAVEWGHLGVIKTLLAKGAKVNAVNDEGNNCLHLALQKDAFHSEEEHIALLDKYAFKLSLTQGNRTCSTVVATYLFHFGANFYHPNGKNVIPLDLIQDRNLKEKLKTFLPPPCTYCQVMYASSECKPCEHIALCRDCYIRIKGESCPTCHQPISGVREFEAPKFEDRWVQTEATCQELGAASQAIESPKSEDKCVQTEVASEEIEAPTHGKFSKVSEPTSSTTKPVESPVLDEKFLQDVAQNLGGKWQQVGRELGIESVQLEIIRYDYPYNTVEQSFQMLRRWFTRCDPEKRTHKTLREALEKVNRTFEDKEIKTLAEPVESVNLDEKLLHSVAKKLGNKWQQLGRELGIKQVDLDIIQYNHPKDAVEQSFRMLYKWFQCCDPANRTLKTLTEALEEIECFDALEHLSLDTN